MRHSLISILALSLVITSCGLLGSKKKRSDSSGVIQGTSDDTGDIKAEVKASQGGEISLSESSNESLKEAKVFIPAGALAVDTTVEVKETTPIVNTTVSEELGIATAAAAGPSIAVEAEDMNALTGTIAIGLPYNKSSSLAGGTNFIVIGMYAVGNQFVAETFVGSELRVGDKVIELDISKFGAYQVARVEERVEKKKAETEAAYVDKSVAEASGANINTAFFILDENQLPSCDGSRVSHLYYVSSTKKFFTCNGSSWSNIAVKGAQGDQGAKGDKGDKGDNASAGPELVDSSNNFFGYLKGYGNNVWVEFVEGFYTMLTKVSSDEYEVRSEPVYFSGENCSGDKYLEYTGFSERDRLSYTKLSDFPYFPTDGTAIDMSPHSVRRPEDTGCHNLLALEVFAQLGMNEVHKISANLGVFPGYTQGEGSELWITDGTPEGTSILKEFRSGSNGGNPWNFVKLGSHIYFSADDGVNGSELWKTDGTLAGTVLVKDISPGSSHSYPANLTLYNSGIVFRANDGTNGDELWFTDGTPGGTVLVSDLRAGSSGSSPSNFIVYNGKVVFVANDGTSGSEMFEFDGSSISLVQDLFSGSSSASPSSFYEFNSKLYFSANDGSLGTELYSYDGASISLVKDIAPSGSYSYPGNFYEFNGELFFTADDQTNGNEIWKTDGTGAGTVLVKDIRSGGSSYPSEFTEVGGKLLFRASVSSGENHLYSTDGTTANTVQLTTTISSTPDAYNLHEHNGQLYFFEKKDGDSYKVLWTSDGTQAGTKELIDINKNSGMLGDIYSFESEIFIKAHHATVSGEAMIKLHLGTDPSKDADPSKIPKSYLPADEMTGYQPVASGTKFKIK